MESTALKIFLSYAKEDSTTAGRLFADLRRFQVEVWGYKECGQYAVNFKQEFETQIRQSNYFCLLDSPAARQSRWVKTECIVATDLRATIDAPVRPIMMVCALAAINEDVDWRDTELWDGQNLHKAFDFSNYDRGIRELSKFLEIAYMPWSTLPRDQDFTKEVHAANIGRERTQELFDLYRQFRESFSDSDYAEAILRVVIRKCQVYKAVPVVSPALALGVMQGDSGRHRDALKTFSMLAETHPGDPRVWAGLGGAYFHTEQYSLCLEALYRSRSIVLNHPGTESTKHMVEVAHNIARVQILLGRNDEATAILNELPPEDKDHPLIRAVRGQILLRSGKYMDALVELQQAYKETPVLSPDLVLDLAECYRHFGRLDDEANVLKAAVQQLPGNVDIYHHAADSFLRRGEKEAAVAAMRSAAQCLPESPRFRSQLAALLYERDEVQEALVEASKIVELAAPTARDRYYRGLAYYIQGKMVTAEDELAESRKNPVVSRWPHYSDVLRLREKPPQVRAAKNRWLGWLF
jgi:Flp pilus assembly protein TadD